MNTLAFIHNLGTFEILIIFFVVLIFFGAKRLPGLFGSFGKALKEFKKATRDIEDDIQTAMNTEAPKQVQPPASTVARNENPYPHVQQAVTPPSPQEEASSEAQAKSE